MLFAKLRAADGILISTPVYFGDRSSLAQTLIDFIASDSRLRTNLAGKIYGGIAVGAKRNGGQETTLIYQLLDMVNLGFLAVGNSSETTAQYGGTAVGGDVGTVHKDDDGIETSIGTGRRVARVAKLRNLGASGPRLADKIQLHLWLLQRDEAGRGLAFFEQWAAALVERNPRISAKIWDVAGEAVVRCIACDVCPVSIGRTETYRCIISNSDDFFVKNHAGLIEADAILVCAYSPEDRADLRSAYQQFIERTRYLRRDNYVFSGLLTAPFVVSELNARQNLHLRMLTSMVRHHTVLHHPLIGMMHQGKLLNAEHLDQTAEAFVRAAQDLLIGRCVQDSRDDDIFYNPLGYEISTAKSEDDVRSGRVAEVMRSRSASIENTRARRLRAN